MKKIFLTSALLFSLSVYGQQTNDFQISELSKFEKTSEKMFSNLNKEDADLTIFYKNGILAYIHIDRKDGEDFVNHKLRITYFVPKISSFVKNKEDKKEILNFIKREIDKNDFSLQTFFDEAYENAIKGVEQSIKITNNGFIVYAVNPDFSSELSINVYEIYDGQYMVNIYYNIVL